MHRSYLNSIHKGTILIVLDNQEAEYNISMAFIVTSSSDLLQIHFCNIIFQAH